ncbi:MAG: leucine--tRNA ligase, partial [bacterium]|nr:leucine--tRNA ligase [bacterium]
RTYPFAEKEAKWREVWENRGDHRVDVTDNSIPKQYVLCMFLYPSGDKLHIGHWWNYAPADTFARLQRMKGYQVFEPMGFDAFGLPAENFAIKNNVHPAVSTKQNIEYIRGQLRRMGNMYDWRYEVNTSSPEYYKWTQWLFVQLYKQGLVEYKTAPLNWCPKDQTVLANEQVVGGCCERCGTPVERRKLAQWFIKITDFADSLLEELDRPVSEGGIDWPDKTKASQKYWIGRSDGASIKFPLLDNKEVLEVFTTRPDTLYGVTYVVLAPEHSLVQQITTPERKADVATYIEQTIKTTEIERMATDRPKTGVFTGAYCKHPLSGENIPVWIADYVLESYGTGIVMAVPAHDQRDFEFAVKYDLPIRIVIQSPDHTLDVLDMTNAYTEPGVMVNSAHFDGTPSEEGIQKIIAHLEEQGVGSRRVTYRLRDWSVSRQRYWGAPVPVIHCPDCGIVLVPEQDLPVRLPEEIIEYRPKGKSPLETAESFMAVNCPNCGKPARRDPDTMDTFTCSSWYYLRFPCAQNDQQPFDQEIVNRMLPVDTYIGGTEHTYGHLLYSRFVCYALYKA